MHFTDQKSEICVIRNDGAKKMLAPESCARNLPNCKMSAQ